MRVKQDGALATRTNLKDLNTLTIWLDNCNIEEV